LGNAVVDVSIAAARLRGLLAQLNLVARQCDDEAAAVARARELDAEEYGQRVDRHEGPAAAPPRVGEATVKEREV
jgi:hypothetical protein